MNNIEKKPRQKIHRVYDEAIMQRCLESIKTGRNTVYRASKVFGIPTSSIHYRIGDKWTKKTRKGPPTVLDPEDEMKIVRWLQGMESKGFPVLKETLLYKIKSYLESSAKPNPFKLGVPGLCYVLFFFCMICLIY